MTAIDTFGDGGDGAYTGGNLVRGNTYNFTSFDLNAAIDITGGTGLTTIYVQGNLSLGASAVINAIKQAIGAAPGDITIFGGKYNANKNADGDTGNGGAGGGGASPYGPPYTGGTGGAGGTDTVDAGDGTDGYSAPSRTGGVGGTGGGKNGGGGGGGGSSNNVYNGGNGGDGAADSASITEEQPTILFIIGGNIEINASATINGAGVDGVTGTTGSAGSAGGYPGLYGGGGGGAGGGGGTSGVKILFYYAGTYSNAGTLDADTGAGGTGGPGGSTGGAGVAGSAGALAGIITKISGIIIKEIFALQANAVAEMDFEGGIASTERGFVHSLTTAPTIADTKTVVSGSGEMDAPITGLLEDTTYYIRPFATNSVETVYGTETSFKTHKSFIPGIIIGN